MLYLMLNYYQKSNMIRESLAPARSSQSQAPCLASAKPGNHNVPGNPIDTTRAIEPLDPRFSQIGNCLQSTSSLLSTSPGPDKESRSFVSDTAKTVHNTNKTEIACSSAKHRLELARWVFSARCSPSFTRISSSRCQCPPNPSRGRPSS